MITYHFIRTVHGRGAYPLEGLERAEAAAAGEGAPHLLSECERSRDPDPEPSPLHRARSLPAKHAPSLLRAFAYLTFYNNIHPPVESHGPLSSTGRLPCSLQ